MGIRGHIGADALVQWPPPSTEAISHNNPNKQNNGSIDPENKDNFDNFNVSPVLDPLFGMLRFFCSLGDPFVIRSPKSQ